MTTRITKSKYNEWADEAMKSSGDDLDKLNYFATKKFKELTTSLHVKVIEHDWKETAEHIRAIAETVRELNACHIFPFEAFHEFLHGGVDSLITVVSKEKITKDFAEILADLVMNLGAD